MQIRLARSLTQTVDVRCAWNLRKLLLGIISPTSSISTQIPTHTSHLWLLILTKNNISNWSLLFWRAYFVIVWHLYYLILTKHTLPSSIYTVCSPSSCYFFSPMSSRWRSSARAARAAARPRPPHSRSHWQARRTRSVRVSYLPWLAVLIVLHSIHRVWRHYVKVILYIECDVTSHFDRVLTQRIVLANQSTLHFVVVVTAIQFMVYVALAVRFVLCKKVSRKLLVGRATWPLYIALICVE